jgi:hypothetical protein
LGRFWLFGLQWAIFSKFGDFGPIELLWAGFAQLDCFLAIFRQLGYFERFFYCWETFGDFWLIELLWESIIQFSYLVRFWANLVNLG